MKVEHSSIRIGFTHASGGLVAKGGDLKTFVIAGQDGKFVPATARIEHDTVVVSSPDVADPAAVRYAWDNYPEGCNIYNSDGLPAAPFRTDTRRTNYSNQALACDLRWSMPLEERASED